MDYSLTDLDADHCREHEQHEPKEWATQIGDHTFFVSAHPCQDFDG